MKYLCLAYYDEKKSDVLPAPELEAIVSRCPAYDADLRASGHLIAQGSLQSPRAAASVRPRHGGASVTDGPRVESAVRLANSASTSGSRDCSAPVAIRVPIDPMPKARAAM